MFDYSIPMFTDPEVIISQKIQSQLNDSFLLTIFDQTTMFMAMGTIFVFICALSMVNRDGVLSWGGIFFNTVSLTLGKGNSPKLDENGLSRILVTLYSGKKNVAHRIGILGK